VESGSTLVLRRYPKTELILLGSQLEAVIEMRSHFVFAEYVRIITMPVAKQDTRTGIIGRGNLNWHEHVFLITSVPARVTDSQIFEFVELR